MFSVAMRTFGLVLIASLTSAAYERPLASHSIREAYFLGRRRDGTTTVFLAQYLRRLPIPTKGPHVAETEIRTPYEQVVLRALQAPDGYSSQQAELDYRARPDLIVVRIRINATPTYKPSAFLSTSGGFRPADFWQDFLIRLVQGEHEFESKKVTGRPVFSSGSKSGGGSLVGADVELEFDAKRVDSAPAIVEVLTPDGQDVRVEFDLEKLR